MATHSTSPVALFCCVAEPLKVLVLKTLKGSATVAVNEAYKRHPAFKGSRLFIFRSYGDHNAGWRANTPVALAAFGAHRRGRREEEWGDGAGMVAWMVSEGRAKHFR